MTDEVSSEKIAELRRLIAECEKLGSMRWSVANDGTNSYVASEDGEPVPTEYEERNFIAAADPETVLALLDEIEAERNFDPNNITMPKPTIIGRYRLTRVEQ